MHLKSTFNQASELSLKKNSIFHGLSLGRGRDMVDPTCVLPEIFCISACNINIRKYNKRRMLN